MDERLSLSERAGVTRLPHGLVFSSATSRLACATTACSARNAAPPWVPQWLKWEVHHLMLPVQSPALAGQVSGELEALYL